MLNWVRTWIELFKIDVEWGKDMKMDFEIRYFCARSAPEIFGFFSKILDPATWRDVGC